MDRKIYPDTRNYYLRQWFGEPRMIQIGALSAGFLLIIMFGVVLL
jgi:hypothetical protein